jgi:DNA polymerase III subunit epsilon
VRLGRWLSEHAARLPIGRRPPSPLLAATRLIVLDVDVTGINVRHDYAKGIAVLPIDSGAFRLQDLSYCPLPLPRQTPLPDEAWRERYRELVELIADSPVLTYNTRFVKHMIKRTAKVDNLPLPFGRWIDLASAIYGAFGSEMNELHSLLRWQARMKIKEVKEHHAVSDVFGMAQMLQTLLAYCEDVGIRTLDDLVKAQNARVWLRGP